MLPRTVKKWSVYQYLQCVPVKVLCLECYALVPALRPISHAPDSTSSSACSRAVLIRTCICNFGSNEMNEWLAIAYVCLLECLHSSRILLTGLCSMASSACHWMIVQCSMAVCLPLPCKSRYFLKCDPERCQSGPMHCLVLCSHTVQQRRI